MKYTTPTYENELFETKDVITVSIAVEEDGENITGTTKAEDILGM